MEKLDVGQLVVASPAPLSVFLTVATDGNHGNGVGICPKEVGVGRHKTRCHTGWDIVVGIECDGPDNRCR